MIAYDRIQKIPAIAGIFLLAPKVYRLTSS